MHCLFSVTLVVSGPVTDVKLGLFMLCQCSVFNTIMVHNLQRLKCSFVFMVNLVFVQLNLH